MTSFFPTFAAVKARFYIVIVLLLLASLAGCTHGASARPAPRGEGAGLHRTLRTPFAKGDGLAHKELADIDSLMWQRADSAFAVLLRFAESDEADSLDAFDGHYFHLLLAELLYKNNYQQTNRDALQQAVAYFDSLADCRPPCKALPEGRGIPSAKPDATLPFLAARAHYINGVGCFERDSVVAACRAYLKALELMETHFPNIATQRITARHGTTSISSDLLLWFMDLTYGRLEWLFSKQFMQEPAIICGKRALAIDTICSFNPYNTSSLFLDLGLQYSKLYELNKEPYLADTAEYYFNEALRHLPDTNNRLFIDVVTQLELLKINMGRDFEPSIIVLKRMAAQTLDENERLCSYLAIGGIYHSYNQYDSALVYLTPVFENKKDPYRQRVIAPYLHEIYLNTGDTAKAALFARYIADNSATEGESNAQVSTLNNLFQQHLQWERDKALAHRQQAERQDRRQRLMWSAMAAAALLLALGLVLRRWLARRKREHEAAAQSWREEKRQLQKQVDHARQQLQSQTDEALQQTRAMLPQRVNEIFHSKVPNRLERIMAEFEAAYPKTMEQLAAAYPELNETEIQIAVLNYLRFRAKEEADLMGFADNTIQKYRSNLKKKAGSDPISALLKE